MNCTAVTARGELEYYPCDTYLLGDVNDLLRRFASSVSNTARSQLVPPTRRITPARAEDCPTLNTRTPHLPNVENTTRKGKAIMVWVHGEGFTRGAASDTTFDGSAMASWRDVVLVTVNYRLSTLGFLALSKTSLMGNYGLHDQSVALDWLRAHIEELGGDKDKITVFRQSAGAASIRALLASPQARDKVFGAIMMSTPQGVEYVFIFSRYLTMEEATNRTAAAVIEVGCESLRGEDTVACLRKSDPLALVGIRNGSQPPGTVARYPVVDGTLLTSTTLPLGPTAHIAARNGVFKSVYSYEFDRAYQIEEWSANPPACEAPVTEMYPYGDPNEPYRLSGSKKTPVDVENVAELIMMLSINATPVSGEANTNGIGCKRKR